jgi:hypothetical protein
MKIFFPLTPENGSPTETKKGFDPFLHIKKEERCPYEKRT